MSNGSSKELLASLQGYRAYRAGGCRWLVDPKGLPVMAVSPPQNITQIMLMYTLFGRMMAHHQDGEVPKEVVLYGPGVCG